MTAGHGIERVDVLRRALRRLRPPRPAGTCAQPGHLARGPSSGGCDGSTAAVLGAAVRLPWPETLAPGWPCTPSRSWDGVDADKHFDTFLAALAAMRRTATDPQTITALELRALSRVPALPWRVAALRRAPAVRRAGTGSHSAIAENSHPPAARRRAKSERTSARSLPNLASAKGRQALGDARNGIPPQKPPRPAHYGSG